MAGGPPPIPPGAPGVPLNPNPLPFGYLMSSSGPATFSGLSITVPAQVIVVNGTSVAYAGATLTAPTMGAKEVAKIVSGGAPSYANNLIYLTKLQVVVQNSSGGSVSGTVVLTGHDEHYPNAGAASATITVPTTTNGSSNTQQTSAYFGAGSGYNATDPALPGSGAAGNLTISLTGTLSNSGVTVTVTEYQYRYFLKTTAGYNAEATGSIGPACNNYYQAGETQFCQMEITAAGIISLMDTRTIGPATLGERLGSEIVNLSSYTPYGPDPTVWTNLCIYAIVETLDGHWLAFGNQAGFFEFDGHKVITTTTPFTCGGLLTISNNITAAYTMGKNTNGNEIIFLGTDTGILIRWDRTNNTFASITGFGSNYVQRIVKGGTTNSAFAVGASNASGVITENGSSATFSSFSSVLFGAIGGTNTVYDSCFYNHRQYAAGGGGTGIMAFCYYVVDSVQPGQNLTPFLPGTNVQRGGTSASSTVLVAALSPTVDGRIYLAGTSGLGGMYIVEWDTKAQYAVGQVAFTVNAATTIQAGTILNGTNAAGNTIQFVTLDPCTATGSGTVWVYAASTTPGVAGMLAVSQTLTLSTPISTVTAITNVQAFGFGRYIGTGANQSTSGDVPNSLISNIPLDIVATPTGMILMSQAGDIMHFDGNHWHVMSKNFFKGRATFGMHSDYYACTVLIGDEGRAMTIPD